MPTAALCKTIIEFGVGWDEIYRIPPDTSFNNLYFYLVDALELPLQFGV